VRAALRVALSRRVSAVRQAIEDPLKADQITTPHDGSRSSMVACRGEDTVDDSSPHLWFFIRAPDGVNAENQIDAHDMAITKL
jgi:hypothetical protein